MDLQKRLTKQHRTRIKLETSAVSSDAISTFHYAACSKCTKHSGQQRLFRLSKFQFRICAMHCHSHTMQVLQMSMDFIAY